MNHIRSEIKWMVTGTPINNDKSDFYNLCVIQGMSKSFSLSAKQIRQAVEDCVLKRTKAQVGIEMPELKENIVDVYFETEKEELFAKNIHNLMSFANVTTDNVDQIISSMGANLQSRFPVLMLMRQCCVYPRLAVKYFMKNSENNLNL